MSDDNELRVGGPLLVLKKSGEALVGRVARVTDTFLHLNTQDVFSDKEYYGTYAEVISFSDIQEWVVPILGLNTTTGTRFTDFGFGWDTLGLTRILAGAPEVYGVGNEINADLLLQRVPRKYHHLIVDAVNCLDKYGWLKEDIEEILKAYDKAAPQIF